VVEISINGVTQRLTSRGIDMTLIELAQMPTFDFHVMQRGGDETTDAGCRSDRGG
jgi:hypothetical protein